MKQIFNPMFFSVLKQGVTRHQLQTDILSGVVVGIVALPLAIAFAVASGVSPEKGLITAVVAGFIISFLGGSRVQIGGPTGAFIVVVYAIIQQYGLSGLFISTIMAGVMLILLGILGLGSLLKFFPRPLVVGFTSGIAVVIFSTQLKDALGLHAQNISPELWDGVTAWSQYLKGISLISLMVTLLTIILMLVTKKLTSRIPGSFVAIVIMTLIVQLMQWPVDTIQTIFGSLQMGFSPGIPELDFTQWHRFIQPALTIAILGGVESLLSAVVSDGMIGCRHRSNTELIAQGIANIVTPFFGGIPATGAIARTATNVKNGGRTPIAGMVHALTLLLVMLFFGRWAKLIPMPVLAGVLIVVAYNMSEWRSFVSIMRASYFDRIVLLVTFALTVLVDLTVAIEVGVILSALLFMKRMSDIGHPDIIREVDSDLIEHYENLPDGIKVFEISGPLFFASAKEYSEVIRSVGGNERVLIIRMRHVPFVDATGLHNLIDTLHSLHSSHIDVVLSGVRTPVLDELRRGGVVNFLGEDHVHSSFDKAVAYARSLVNA